MKLLFGIILAIGLITAITAGLAGNFKFVGQTADLFSKTWTGIWSGGSEKPAAEINLDVDGAGAVSGADSKRNFQTPPERTPAEKMKGTNAPEATTAGEIPAPSDSQKTGTAVCDFQTGQSPSREVIISEIAWMGSPAKNGDSGSAAGNNEWLELKNISTSSIGLSGWQLADSEGKIKITFGEKENLGAQNFYLLERTDDDSVPNMAADKIYSGGLANGGAWLRLFDKECRLIDEIDASSGWPGGDNGTKQTLERSASFGWQTSLNAGGTPKAENSAGAKTEGNAAVPTSTAAFSLTVIKSGNGSGTVASGPSGINCGSKCVSGYPAEARVALQATASAGSVFGGWIGWENCGSGESCAVIMERNLSLIANFDLAPQPPASNPNNPPQSNPAASIVIAEIQITGGTGHTTDDFVKIYNPSPEPFNLKGYRLVKRTKTGTGDTSLKSWTADAFVPAGGYYVWANSGFVSLSPTPDITTSGSIANDNGVALRDGPEDTGQIIDAVAWGAAQNSFIEGTAFPQNPGASQILKRKFAGGVIQDTNNNADDFEL